MCSLQNLFQHIHYHFRDALNPFPEDHQCFSKSSVLSFSAKLLGQAANGPQNAKIHKKGITKVRHVFQCKLLPHTTASFISSNLRCVPQ